MSVKMYGPALDGSGTIVNRDVAENDVNAYEQSGYKKGSVDGAPTAEEYGASKAKDAPKEKGGSDEGDGEKKGKLPEDFPGFAALAESDIHTYAQVRKVEDLTALPGIGEATAEKIVEALKG